MLTLLKSPDLRILDNNKLKAFLKAPSIT